MKVADFLEEDRTAAQRFLNDLALFKELRDGMKREHKARREEYFALIGYIKRKPISPDLDMELGGEAHDFDAKFINKSKGAISEEVVEVVQALPSNEHKVRIARAKGRFTPQMLTDDLDDLHSFPSPIIDAINRKHQKRYSDERTLLVSVRGDYTYESDQVIEGWMPEIRALTKLGGFTAIYIVEPDRPALYRVW